MALKKLCSKCNKIIEYGRVRCAECEAKYDKQKKEDYKYYDDNVRDKKTKEFYDSLAWKKVKKAIKIRDFGGLCMLCRAEANNNAFADVVHHIEPLKENYDKRLNYSNLICLCNRHHMKVHRVYDSNNSNKLNMQVRLKKLIQKSKEEF